MKAINWDNVQEVTGFERPIPGGYVGRILHVKDVEPKEYLIVEWDFEDGNFKGDNQETFSRAGFWPLAMYRSYKESALGFFKAFKTSVEESNPGYSFDCAHPERLEGKLVGIILGEEEYRKNNGAVGVRTYVYQTRSVKAILDGDFKVPDLKRMAGNSTVNPPPAAGSYPSFAPIDDIDDSNLPF